MQITNSDYQSLAPELYRFVSYRLNSAADAEDVVSMAFIRLLNETQNVTNPKAWLYTVARNIIYDKYKKQARETELNEEVIEFTIDKADAENQIIDELMLEQVKTHLQNLDAITQEIIVLRIWEELTFGEIAEIIHQKEDTVKKKFYRGIEKLRSMMEETGVKRRAIALPIIIAGLIQLAKDPGYQMNTAFKNTLFNSLRNMPEGQPVSLLAKLKLFLASKWGIALLAFLGISAIALIALIVALVSNRPGGNGNGNTSTSATTVATSSATTAANSAATSSGPRTQDRLLFNPNEMWFGGSRPYPAELRNLYDDQLQQVTCSDQAYGYGFENPNSAADYKGVEDDRPIQDSELISLINSLNAALNTKVNDVFRCKTADGKVIAVYNVWAGGGGMDSIGYTGYVQNNLVPNPVAIPNDGPAYFSCRGMLAILNDGAYYVRCGGGDGTGGSSSIYLIDPAARTKALTEKCDIDGMTVTCSN